MEYTVYARRLDKHQSEARTKNAILALDTDVNGRLDAFNPAELLLASIAACMIKGIERVSPLISFHFRGVEVKLHSVRQNTPPINSEIYYELIVDTDESDQNKLLHSFSKFRFRR